MEENQQKDDATTTIIPAQEKDSYQAKYGVQQTSVSIIDDDPANQVMSVKAWLITCLIFLIPCVNLIMAFVWAFGSGNKNRRNFFRAYLILLAVFLVLYLIIFAIFGSALYAWLEDLQEFARQLS